jgi:hypothetical protein
VVGLAPLAMNDHAINVLEGRDTAFGSESAPTVASHIHAVTALLSMTKT